ncbi:MAG: MmgE/PrpD family protein [Bradyrhizobium sp.]
MTGEAASISEVLAGLVADTSWADLAGQSHEAKRSILNFFATAIGSSGDPAVTTALAVLKPLSGPAAATIIGRDERLDTFGAAFVNAISANLLDFDDTHLDTIIHPAAPVAAAVLAMAEPRNCSGRDVLTAFILGVDVECRIGNAVSPGHYARGWHITSTCGVFGAAAATAKLLGLPAAKIAHALGIAASQSAGLVENLPSAAKNVSVGNAARNGIFAALLAQGGYDAAPRAIEGPLGWARAMGDEPDLARLTRDLGRSWEIAKNTYKPYPAGIVFHAVIDACLKLRVGLAIDDIELVTVSGSQLLLARGDRAVRNERDARVSIHHCAACALLIGAAGVAEFEEATVFRPDMMALRAKVRAELDRSLPDGAARVAIRLKSGQLLDETVMAARGSLSDPLGDTALEAKLRDALARSGSRWDGERLIAAIWGLEELADISSLLHPCNPPRSVAAANRMR